MAVVITQTVVNTDLAGPNFIDAPAVTPASGERLLAFLTNDISVVSTDPTFDDDQGNTWNQLDKVTETGNQRLYAYECVTPAVGVSTTVTADWGAAVGSLGIEVHRISGAGTVAGRHSTNWQVTPGTGTDGVTSTNLTPSSAPGLIIACSLCTHISSGGTPSAGTGFTSIETMWNNGTFDGARSEKKAYSTTSAQAATFTATGNRDHLTIAVAIAQPAAAGTTFSVVLGQHKFID